MAHGRRERRVDGRRGNSGYKGAVSSTNGMEITGIYFVVRERPLEQPESVRNCFVSVWFLASSTRCVAARSPFLFSVHFIS